MGNLRLPIADLRLGEGSAFDAAREKYVDAGVRDFDEDLFDHHRSGFVYSMPGMFAMAKAVVLDDGRLAWHVHEAFGPILSLLAIMPFPLPYVALRRRTDRTLRVYSTERLRAIASRFAALNSQLKTLNFPP